MFHASICIQTTYGRNGFVVSAPKPHQVERLAESFKNRIGYVVEQDFALAVKRSQMMERNEVNAWGIVKL